MKRRNPRITLSVLPARAIYQAVLQFTQQHPLPRTKGRKPPYSEALILTLALLRTARRASYRQLLFCLAPEALPDQPVPALGTLLYRLQTLADERWHALLSWLAAQGIAQETPDAPFPTPVVFVDGTGVGFNTPFYAQFRRGAEIRRIYLQGLTAPVKMGYTHARNRSRITCEIPCERRESSVLNTKRIERYRRRRLLSKNARTFLTIVGFVLVLLLLMQYLRQLQPVGARELTYTALVNAVEQRTIAEATVQGNRLVGTLRDGTPFHAALPPEGSARDSLYKRMTEAGINLKFTEDSRMPDYLSQMLGMFLVVLLIGGLFWFLLMRSAQAGNNQAFSFGKARARRYNENIPRVTFDDVAGVEEAKQELAEIVDYLKNTQKYQKLGAKIPKGVLLLGPPGCGKTLLARAVAGEAGVPFFHISGSDFVEMFVGVGAARVRDLFETAKANRPALIFIDEIDAVGRQRGTGLGGGHDEREQTLNQLLVEMDGFDPNLGIIVIAATNRADILDPALLRPGRFDRHIVVDPPDVEGRKKILEVHTKGKPLAPDVDIDTLAKRTPGFTGADLANLVNEAALIAARRNKTRITMDEFEEAVDRVIAGPQRRNRVVDQREREVIAYHEVGHAIVGELLPEAEPVHKISILPRGMALGYTIQMPERDRYLYTRQSLLDRITTMLGGRVAEEIVFGEVGTGAHDDLKRATEIARAMVTEYGMSDKLGPLTFGRRHGNPFLGRDIMEDRNYSEQIAYEIDQEVRRIIEECYQRAREILMRNRDKMDRIVQALMERENLSREEFLALMRDEEGDQPAPTLEPAPPPAATTPEPADASDAPAKRLRPRTAPSS